MYVLHTHWHPPTTPAETETAGVLFWVETSETQPLKQKGRKSRVAQPHPFCADPKETFQQLLLIHPQIPRGHTKQVSLLLPTTKFGPQPSPQLQHDWDIEDNASPTLTAWLIGGVWLPPVEAFTFLSNLPSAESMPPQLTLGADSHYWQIVANLTLETLAQQKILPVLAQADASAKSFHARWLPILDGPQDGPRFARLLEAMPPICRAEAKTAGEAPSPRLVLDTFLNTMTDALARQWGQAKAPTFPQRERDPARDWLQALFRTSPEVSGSAAQLGRLKQSHKLWLRNLHVAGDKHFRIAFRLEAPAQQASAADEKNWQLHYLLQAQEDPSLLVPAQQVWQVKGNVLNTLNRRIEQPQEKLLVGLGYAARLFEPLQQSLKTAKPSATSLSSPEAFNFLRESASLLEASGFGVLVPPWWNKPGTRLGVRLKMSSGNAGPGADVIPKSRISFDNIIRYKWELSLGETTLSREEFDALAALKSPLVQIRGQWVQLDPEQIEAAIHFWEKHALEGEIDLQNGLRLGLGARDNVEGLPVEQVEFEGWLADWMKQFTGHEKLAELPPPQSLQAELRPYQRYGYSWLDFLRRWGMGACLADDMGLGKTIQTITMLLREKEEQGKLPGPTLLICPTSVVSNWAREVRRFAPTLTTMMHQGGDRLRDQEFVEHAGQVDLVLTSYNLARRDADLIKSINWFGVILDEAQNIKNPEAKQTRAIRQFPANFRLALTGTPVENRLSELWSIMHFLNPGYLGSRQSFRQNFALPIERYQDEEAVQRLKKMVSPFILRRVKTDPTVIQDLPDKHEMKVYCNLSEEQATLYESIVKSAMEEVTQTDGIERKGLVLGMLMKLKQVCNHPAQFLHQIGDGHSLETVGDMARSGKLARLTEMLEEAISVGDRVLIFTQFAEMGQLLKRHLQDQLGVSTMFLYGGTPAKKRTVMVKRFQEDPNGPPIFILSLKAGGVGLNLTRANQVFHFDRWWNPAVENQATDRAFRIGQRRDVLVYKFVCVGTMEEMIDDMIESKKALAESVVGGGENWLTELSTDELRDLVTLKRETIR